MEIQVQEVVRKKVTVEEWEHRYDGRGRGRGTALALVFVHGAGRPGTSDILADFRWRRSHQQPLSNETVLALIRPLLEAKGERVRSVSYSRKAGCSCPCSPGYVVRGIHPHWGGRFAFTITLSPPDLTVTEAGEALKAAETALAEAVAAAAERVETGVAQLEAETALAESATV